MDQEPIYRAAHRRTRAPMFAWRRTASLVSAAAALTVSGVALGYQGVGSMPSAELPARQLSVPSVPVPNIIVPLANGGHPDLIGALSAQLISTVQAPLRSPVAAPPTPVALRVEGPLPMILPEAPTPAPFVLSVTIADPAPVADEADVDVAGVQAASGPAAAPALALRASPRIAPAEAVTDQVEADAPAVVDEPPPPPPAPAPVQAAPAPVRAATPVPTAPVKVSTAAAVKTPEPQVVRVQQPKIEPPAEAVRKPDPPGDRPKPPEQQKDNRKDNSGKDGGGGGGKQGNSGPHH